MTTDFIMCCHKSPDVVCWIAECYSKLVSVLINRDVQLLHCVIQKVINTGDNRGV